MVQIKAFSYNPNAKYQPSGVYKTKDPDITKQTIEVKQPSDSGRQQFQGQVPRRIRQKHAALRRK